MSSPSVMRSALDRYFSLHFVGPLTVLFWRGTFNTVSNLAFTGEWQIIYNVFTLLKKNPGFRPSLIRIAPLVWYR